GNIFFAKTNPGRDWLFSSIIFESGAREMTEILTKLNSTEPAIRIEGILELVEKRKKGDNATKPELNALIRLLSDARGEIRELAFFNLCFTWDGRSFKPDSEELAKRLPELILDKARNVRIAALENVLSIDNKNDCEINGAVSEAVDRFITQFGEGLSVTRSIDGITMLVPGPVVSEMLPPPIRREFSILLKSVEHLGLESDVIRLKTAVKSP
ncbi:MAG: hypothetical protein ABIC40_05555, partial [bacterium]